MKNAWDQWVKRPQRLWLRRVLFQLHLWAGIGLGVYIIVIFLSGSAAVFNREIYTAFLPESKTVEISGPRLSAAELKAAAQRAHPGSPITRVTIWRDPHEAAIVSLGQATYADQRFMDPYTGKDLGTARPLGLRMVSFFSVLHMNLIMGYTGRLINGVGGFLTTVVNITGIVIWWPGIRRWRASLTLRRDVNVKRFNWDLHSVIGFWTFAIVCMWALTGTYMVFPSPFDKAINLLPHAGRFMDVFGIVHLLHVGDFAGWPVKVLWVVLGLTPPVLFVTGAIMWWNRVLNPWRKRQFVAAQVRTSGHTTHPSATTLPSEGLGILSDPNYSETIARLGHF